MSYYPHTTFTFCSSAKKLGFDVKKSFKEILKSFEKGAVTYPRTDGINHMHIKVLKENLITDDLKIIMKHSPILNKEKDYIIGDVYTLSGELALSTPASLIEDVEKAKKIKETPDKIDLYIGLRRQEYLNEDCLFVDLNQTSFNLFKKIFEKDYQNNKDKIPSFNKEKASGKSPSLF